MKHLKLALFAGISAVLFFGCDDITNPVNEFGEQTDPYVRFQDTELIGAPEATVSVIFQLPTAIEENVSVTYSLGGDAVFGDDYTIVDTDGNVREDVTVDGGTATIVYDPDASGFDRDTLFVLIDFDATDGSLIEVSMDNATTESGQSVTLGRGDRFSSMTVSIEGFVDIPTGVYNTVISGLLSDEDDLDITQPADPVEVDGVPYDFMVSSFHIGVFGGPVPWVFNVTSGGNVIAAPHLAGNPDVTADVTGTFDFDSNVLVLDVTLTCCGGEGLEWTMTYTYAD